MKKDCINRAIFALWMFGSGVILGLFVPYRVHIFHNWGFWINDIGGGHSYQLRQCGACGLLIKRVISREE